MKSQLIWNNVLRTKFLNQIIRKQGSSAIKMSPALYSKRVFFYPTIWFKIFSKTTMHEWWWCNNYVEWFLVITHRAFDVTKLIWSALASLFGQSQCTCHQRLRGGTPGWCGDFANCAFQSSYISPYVGDFFSCKVLSIWRSQAPYWIWRCTSELYFGSLNS